MDIYFSLSYWLFLIQFWIILGILFTGLEIIDGKKIKQVDLQIFQTRAAIIFLMLLGMQLIV